MAGYMTKLGLAVTGIEDYLDENQISYKSAGSTLSFNTDENMNINKIKDDIDDIVVESFGCKKASKRRKYTFLENMIFIRFKKEVH